MTSDLNTTARGLRPASEPIRNVVLVGRTGTGKSSTGNSLLGERLFAARRYAGGVTSKCEMRSAAIQDGPIINVIDTPGLFDLAVCHEILDREILNCFHMAEEGLHAVLVVLSTRTRISRDDDFTFNEIQVLFGSQIFDYMIVVFTGGDDLKADEITLDDYLSGGCPEYLKAILRMCGGRKVLFDNKTNDEGEKVKQVQELLAHVETIYKNTDGIPFTRADLQHVKEETDKLTEADLAAMEKLRMEQMIQHASAATHEREIRELKETLRHFRCSAEPTGQSTPTEQRLRPSVQLECNIM